MSVVSIGLDLAKSVFQVHGVDASGHAVLRRTQPTPRRFVRQSAGPT
jgi:hypothetical protein